MLKWKRAALVIIAGAGVLPLLRVAEGGPAKDAAKDVAPSIVAKTPEAAGRYLVQIAGCNDCHTPGFMQRGEAVPESEWLVGVGLGFKGPWGTSYAPNLRAKVHKLPEDSWVAGVKSTSGRPPMPWAAVHAMSDADLRSLYRYIRTLPPSDNMTPAPLPPGQTPMTPYIVFEPVVPQQ